MIVFKDVEVPTSSGALACVSERSNTGQCNSRPGNAYSVQATARRGINAQLKDQPMIGCAGGVPRLARPAGGCARLSAGHDSLNTKTIYTHPDEELAYFEMERPSTSCSRSA